jgi:hypothetical protein
MNNKHIDHDYYKCFRIKACKLIKMVIFDKFYANFDLQLNLSDFSENKYYSDKRYKIMTKINTTTDQLNKMLNMDNMAYNYIF